ncbi:class I SAM-dependent methyltransferase [uncultured Tateyamaria sp.]|uniref:class I SAM-dependent methyltransferase n=1 Tax=uncultured Tateyamaria sp. TaxID=455651 RepID=UPI00262FB308|nr:class I SAM-dependent methyltransferase [uncultured Tateyamaria sp.]
MNTQVALNSTLKTCRCCRSENLLTFLPMGNHPPANMFVRPEELNDPQPAFPLNTQGCLDCGLIQVADQIPEGFFTHYLYVPSGATTMHTHFKSFAQVLEGIAKGGLIIDIGCNDGLMLGFANANGSRTLGIDPAANLAEIAAKQGVEVHVAYLTPETAQDVVDAHGRAQAIATSNTFNHIGDLHGFMASVDILLAEDGTFVIEVPWGKAIMETNEFDNVYHEHMSELSLLSIVKLGQATGFDVVDVTKLPVHGGSMRVFMRKASQGVTPTPIVAEMIENERAAGLLDRDGYLDFAARVQEMKVELLALLSDIKAKGQTIAGYGAPAKGNTLLNYFGIGPETLDFLVDRNPLKQGLYAPGSKIPILAPTAVAERKPDYMLVLAWNFFDEIRTQLSDYEATGGKFIVPLPMPRIVGADSD